MVTLKRKFLAGHSMGEFGTIQFAFKESGRFAKACFMSSAVNPEKLLNYDWYDFSIEGIIGNKEDTQNTALNLHQSVEDTVANKTALPDLYMMSGTDDDLYEDNLEFKAFLKGKGIDFKYEEEPGGHDWDYWNAGIEKVIEWFVN